MTPKPGNPRKRIPVVLTELEWLAVVNLLTTALRIRGLPENLKRDVQSALKKIEKKLEGE